MTASMEKMVRALRLYAETGIFSGIIRSEFNNTYLDSCRAYHRQTGSMLIYTRDSGYHTGGWWKNPDYERCYHLSVSFRDPETDAPRPYDKKIAAQWVKALFGNDDRLTWCEPPYTPEGKVCDVYHYRLFCDPSWTPIKPRGEVYSRDFTEKGWKSFSDLHGEQREVS